MYFFAVLRFYFLSCQAWEFFFPACQRVSCARSGAAKAGLALSASTLAIAGALLIFFCSVLLFSPEGSSFLSDYIHILTDDNVSDEELYNFLDEYLNGFEGDAGTDSWDYENSPDYYEDFDEFQLPPEFFQQPETDNGGNFI